MHTTWSGMIRLRTGTTNGKSETLKNGLAIITSTNERAVFQKDCSYLKQRMTSQTSEIIPRTTICGVCVQIYPKIMFVFLGGY